MRRPSRALFALWTSTAVLLLVGFFASGASAQPLQELVPVELGDSDTLSIGDRVVAGTNVIGLRAAA